MKCFIHTKISTLVFYIKLLLKKNNNKGVIDLHSLAKHSSRYIWFNLPLIFIEQLRQERRRKISDSTREWVPSPVKIVWNVRMVFWSSSIYNIRKNKEMERSSPHVRTFKNKHYWHFLFPYSSVSVFIVLVFVMTLPSIHCPLLSFILSCCYLLPLPVATAVPC